MKGSLLKRKIAEEAIDLKSITDYIQRYEAALVAYKEVADILPAMVEKVNRTYQQTGDPATKKYLEGLSNRLKQPFV